MSVALILSRGIEPALTAVGSSINFIDLGCARLMLRVNEKSERNQLTLTDTYILLRAWLASLDSLTLIGILRHA